MDVDPVENYYHKLESALAKKTSEEMDTVQLKTLKLELVSGDTILYTELSVSGIRNQSVLWETEDPIPPRQWNIRIESYDENGLLVHEGNGVLLTDEDGVEVVINLVITFKIYRETIGDDSQG